MSVSLIVALSVAWIAVDAPPVTAGTLIWSVPPGRSCLVQLSA
jgi:hypothetical protein